MTEIEIPECGYECVDHGEIECKDAKYCKCKPSKLFKTIIDTKPMWVYDLPDKTHMLGEMNGCPNTWWLAYEYWDTDVDDICSGVHGKRISWIPWIDKGGNRPCWKVIANQGNYIKNKWNENNIRGNCSITLECNGIEVYSFGCRDIEFGMAKAQVMMIELMEHPFNFMNPEEEIGRRIWWKDQPAVIERLILDQGCAIIKYVGIGAGFDTSNARDQSENDVSESFGEMTVKDDLLSPKIWWFRDEGQGETLDNGLIEVINNRGHRTVFPNGLYEKVKQDVEYEFKRTFGIKHGFGSTIFFDRELTGFTANVPLEKYNEALVEFHKKLVRDYRNIKQ